MITRLGGKTPLLPQPDQEHYSDRVRCPACKRRRLFVWVQPTIHRPAAVKQPNYIIVDRGVTYPFGEFNIVATADNLMMARAGYSAAAMFYDKHEITLQPGTYIIIRATGWAAPSVDPTQFQDMREMEREVNCRSVPTGSVDQKASKAS